LAITRYNAAIVTENYQCCAILYCVCTFTELNDRRISNDDYVQPPRRTTILVRNQ